MVKVPKVISGSVNYMDLFLAGGLKYFTERMLIPYVGNSNIKSGAVKLGAGLAVKRFVGGGMLGNSMSMALAIDGVEDILMSVLGGKIGGSTQESW